MAETLGAKRCSLCGEHHPASAFLKKCARCPSCRAAVKKEYLARPGVRDRINATIREWRARNAELVNAYDHDRRWNPDKRQALLDRQRQHYLRYQDDYIAAKVLRRTDPEQRTKDRRDEAGRRAARLNARPSWANQDAIKAVYAGASRMRARFDRAFHVDHIVPLNGRTVCGLHVEANLQVLDGILNMEKSNTQWPDMWA